MATILIIDDDPDFRESLSETLVDLGHAPVPAATAQAGLAALDTADFDVVLLDFRLPDGDGVEVLRRLASTGGPPAMPVIMLTAFASPDNTIEAMKLGAFDHLTKPIGRADLEVVLARAPFSHPTWRSMSQTLTSLGPHGTHRQRTSWLAPCPKPWHD